MSSETGMPDDHDLYSFEVFEVNPPPRKVVSDKEIRSCLQRFVHADLRFTKNRFHYHFNRKT